jgi:hypothetical protein
LDNLPENLESLPLYVQEIVCFLSCEREEEGQLAADSAQDAPLYVHKHLDHINDDDLDVSEEEEDNHWRSGLGQSPGCVTVLNTVLANVISRSHSLSVLKTGGFLPGARRSRRRAARLGRSNMLKSKAVISRILRYSIMEEE